MTRRLLNLLTALSLLLCVAVVALWVRSYFVCDLLMGENTPAITSVGSSAGSIIFNSVVRETDKSEGIQVEWRQEVNPVPVLDSHFAALRTFAVDEPIGSEPPLVVVPHWAFAVVPAIAPLAYAARRKRRKDGTQLVCATCGYDLRATPDRCPECGVSSVRDLGRRESPLEARVTRSMQVLDRTDG